MAFSGVAGPVTKPAVFRRNLAAESESTWVKTQATGKSSAEIWMVLGKFLEILRLEMVGNSVRILDSMASVSAKKMLVPRKSERRAVAFASENEVLP